MEVHRPFLTVMAVEFGRNDELGGRELGFDSIYNLQNKSCSVFKTPAVLQVSLVSVLIPQRGHVFYPPHQSVC
jgi:hypothetical protein